MAERGRHIGARRPEITFTRLTEIAPADLVAHMSDPRMAAHMPLLTADWDETTAAAFIAAKEACWRRDGLGHWAILADGVYVGWGGFQKEGAEWDFGLVLRPEAFGLGMRIAKRAFAFARDDARLSSISVLLAPSRKHVGALARIGATSVGEIDYGGVIFRKYRLNLD